MSKSTLHEPSDAERAARGQEVAVKEIRSKLEAACREACASCSIENYIRLLDETPKSEKYSTIIPGVAALWQRIARAHGEQTLEAYNKLTMLTLMDAFAERSKGRNYPESIVSEFHSNFDRITRLIVEATPEIYHHTSDILLKDLAICRQKAFPVGGAWIADAFGGFSRAPLLSGGACQFARFAYFLTFVVRGNAPFYVTHTHQLLLDDFSEGGWARCHAHLAEMLERHREIKGWFASGWLYDPVLEDVSPRLSYMHGLAHDNGAWAFRIGVDIDGGALAKSATRRKLYEEGSYVPTGYLLVWPRDKLIAWARQTAA